jgi:endonuclease VIII
MPEGDTIFKAATVLRRALLGQTIVDAEAPSPKPLGRWPISRLVGTTVEAVEPRGKHLLLRFSNGLSLHTHLQMAGSWHIYRKGERWRRPRYLARVVLQTADFEAICFSAPTVELLSEVEEQRHEPLRSLGPDLLADDFDPASARERLKALPETEIGPALLEQRALAGIGNVYKSELLFLGRVDPFSRVADLADETLDQLISEAQRLLRANVGTRQRVTTGVERPGAELWVYGRQGRPCRRCGTAIQMTRQAGRSTYWCPTCQK